MYWNTSKIVNNDTGRMININMRCIEMRVRQDETSYSWGLTLTWDVLKLRMIQCNSFSKHWLTLTWDVLKWINLYFICVSGND